MRADLERGGGALAFMNGRTVGCLRFEPARDYLHVRRVAVDPQVQGQGVGTALMVWAHEYASSAGFGEVRVGVRVALRENLGFYERLGYRLVEEHRHPGYSDVTWLEMARPV